MLDKNLKLHTKIIVYAILIALALLLSLPFVYMLSIALATPESMN